MRPASQAEVSERDAILSRILDAIRANVPILLPRLGDSPSAPSPSALLSLATEPNPYGGSRGDYRYQFEGEEDLLHLFVVRADGEPLPVEEAQNVVSFVLPGVSPAFLMLKPGRLSHHFYVGHDFLLENLNKP